MSLTKKVVVGLGNPGSRYRGTRHNLGFAVIDILAENPGCSGFQERFHTQLAERLVDTQLVLLAKPQTFMNRSGPGVRQVVDYFQVPLEDLLVVCDDINLPLGTLRVRTRGTHGGHNGLRDIQNHLGTTQYPRLRIGVDSPGEKDAVEYVLGRFRPTERPVIEEAIARAAQAVAFWIQQGIAACMNQYNG